MIGLQWLAEGENPIGGDSPARIRIPDGGVEDPGSVVVSGGVALLRTRDTTMPLASDADSGGERPFLERGPLSLSLIARGGRLAVRVRDREAAARRAVAAIASFPIDPAWRIEARFERFDPPRTIPVSNVLGGVDAEILAGAVVFARGGREHRLDAIAERGESDYWIVFGDATNGRDTYGGGRFVYAPPPVDGRTVVDFNKAYNPPCVFTPFSTCPLPLPQNRMTIRVEAGEKKVSLLRDRLQEVLEHPRRGSPDDV